MSINRPISFGNKLDIELKREDTPLGRRAFRKTKNYIKKEFKKRTPESKRSFTLKRINIPEMPDLKLGFGAKGSFLIPFNINDLLNPEEFVSKLMKALEKQNIIDKTTVVLKALSRGL